MVPRQFFIEEMLLKIYHQAYFINIIRKIYVEFLGNPLLLKAIWFAPLAQKFDIVSRHHQFYYVCIIILVVMPHNACQYTY